MVEGLWLKTGKIVYKDVYKFWVKIFAITFGMGVVSGVVMSYELGTNWAGFADKVSNVIGPLFGFEVLTAFFLEASFLGIMLFGWNKVSPRMHYAATLIVAIGTLVSAFWILSANSWMHTPAGFEIGQDNIFYPKNWLEIIFNPSFPFRFLHMITAAYLTTAFVVGGVASWYLWHKQYLNCAKVMFAMAMLIAVFVPPVQLFLGDLHGLNTLKYQPAKIAAIEGIWETETGAPLRLFGWPDQEKEETKYSIEIPKLSSLILTHRLDGTVKGLKEWPKADRPPVAIVFWCFRVMVGIGILMACTGMIALWLYFKKRLFNTRWFQIWCMAMTPSGFIAVLAGWFVTEIGRQPYLVYGLQRTADLASPVPAPHVLLSLMAFVGVYLLIFGAGMYYILRLILKGPGLADGEGTYGIQHLKAPQLVDNISREGESHA